MGRYLSTTYFTYYRFTHNNNDTKTLKDYDPCILSRVEKLFKCREIAVYYV